MSAYRRSIYPCSTNSSTPNSDQGPRSKRRYATPEVVGAVPCELQTLFNSKEMYSKNRLSISVTHYVQAEDALAWAFHAIMAGKKHTTCAGELPYRSSCLDAPSFEPL